MNRNKDMYRGLAGLSGWLALIAFVLGGITLMAGINIFFAGNDYWQAAVFLALFGIFATLQSKQG